MSKLNLDKLKVQSFVTSLNPQKKDTVKGGDVPPSWEACDDPSEGFGCGGGGTYVCNGTQKSDCCTNDYYCGTDPNDGCVNTHPAHCLTDPIHCP